MNINTIPQKSCTGCGTCVAICPLHCISMSTGNGGFMIPHADETICTDCGQCAKHCSSYIAADNNKPLDSFVFQDKDRDAVCPDSYVNISAPAAEKIHERLLLIMKELHRVCIENNIRYYIIGGTALGARRHNGFIPWDDDADVGMPRPDYEKFCTLADRCFPNFIERRYFKTEKNSPFHFVKLIDNRTTLIEQKYKDYIEGLYIDVFPIDGVGKYSIYDKIKCKYIWNVHKIIIYRCSTEKKSSLIKNIIAGICKKMNLSILHDVLEKALLSTPYISSEYVANYLGAWGKREIMQKRLFGTPVLYHFEDAEFYGPEKIDEYLTNLYGDYMTPPPPEKRVFRHEYPLLDLNMPFRMYEEKQKKQG